MTRHEKKLMDNAIQRAISGLLIPMLKIPPLYAAMVKAYGAGLRERDLAAYAAAWLADNA